MAELNWMEIAIRLPVVLLALTVHEFCHAYFAYRMGDPTAYRMGRVSLNPLRHLDPLGTICLIFAPIGWAKPVPINPLNFYHPSRGMLVATAAGPASNLLQAVLFGLALRGVIFWAEGATRGENPQVDQFVRVLTLLCWFGVMINVGLAVFNLLPLFPLDGFHIAMQSMAPANQERFASMAPYGSFVILGLVLIENAGVGILSKIISPIQMAIFRYVVGVDQAG